MRIRKTAEERRTEIVETAVRLADELGPDRLTTEAIAKEVGLTQPGIFRHFPRKQEIWEAVAGWVGARLRERWAAADRAADTPEERLRALLHGQLDLIRTVPAIPAILFSRELHAGNEALRNAFLRLLTEFRGVVAGHVRAGCRDGRFRPDLDPDDAASLVVALVQGLAVRWSLSGRRFDLAAEGDRLLTLLIEGLAARPDAMEASR